MSIENAQSELILRAKRGDGAAFADLIQPEYRGAIRLANALLHSMDAAEDAVQEASFKAWRKLGNLREGSPLRPWYLAIVGNECRSVRRTRWWTSRSDDEPPEEPARSTDVAASVDLRTALARLDHDKRLVLVLRYYLDMSIEDIALTLDITPKAARSRLDRAVSRLRPILRVQEAVL